MERAAFRAVTAIQAAATAGVGLVAIRLAGAPASASMVQAVALVLGGLLAVGLVLRPIRPGKGGAIAILAVCLLLALAPLVGGAGTEGVRRWLTLGPVTVQPASIILPFVAIAWTRAAPGPTAGALVGLIALALALQPDAASATGLALALAGPVLVRRKAGAVEIAAIACAVAAAVWSWTRVDPLPAVAYVERVIVTAFAADHAVGALAGVLLCLLPAPFAWRALRAGPTSATRVSAAALAGLWIGLVAANLVGNYPAPMLGYGASLALAWLASLGLAGWPDRRGETQAQA